MLALLTTNTKPHSPVRFYQIFYLKCNLALLRASQHSASEASLICLYLSAFFNEQLVLIIFCFEEAI